MRVAQQGFKKMAAIEHLQEAAVEYVAVPTSVVTEFNIRFAQLEKAIEDLKKDGPDRRALLRRLVETPEPESLFPWKQFKMEDCSERKRERAASELEKLFMATASQPAPPFQVLSRTRDGCDEQTTEIFQLKNVVKFTQAIRHFLRSNPFPRGCPLERQHRSFISDEMALFLGRDPGTEMRWYDMLREVCQYIVANDLNNKTTSHGTLLIEANAPLALLLNLNEFDWFTQAELHFELLLPHFLPKEVGEINERLSERQGQWRRQLSDLEKIPSRFSIKLKKEDGKVVNPTCLNYSL